MAKILISPLGAGGKFEKSDEFKRQYSPATYNIDGRKYPESKFVASVLYQHLQLDGIIFIGTVKSMWEEVYNFFCETKGVNRNDEYWYDLATQIDSCNCRSSLDSLDLSKVREVLGSYCQCILIKYGTNQEELWENFDRVIEAINSLRDGDELYIDIIMLFVLFQFYNF